MSSEEELKIQSDSHEEEGIKDNVIFSFLNFCGFEQGNSYN